VAVIAKLRRLRMTAAETRRTLGGRRTGIAGWEYVHIVIDN
jgi:hypothetical protein